MTESLEAASPVLSIRNLKTHFFTDLGVVPAVDGVDLEVFAGQTLGVVGESGCGKSVTGLSAMRLVAPPGKIVSGEILLRDENLLTLTEKEMQQRRGRDLGMIFQEPMTSLDPLYPVRDPLMEALLAHTAMTKQEALQESIRLLGAVGIPNPEKRVNSYPHELSGGMRQRVMIAVALSCKPAVLIADEPTTALDVTVQAQILALLRDLQKETGTAILMITHNLGLVAENCQTVAVMYAGKVVEKAPVRTLFKNPRHPYTQGLLRAVPRLDHPPKQPLPTIPGMVPNPLRLPTGCRFRSRCLFAIDKCAAEQPPLAELGGGHVSACWVQPEFSLVPSETRAAS